MHQFGQFRLAALRASLHRSGMSALANRRLPLHRPMPQGPGLPHAIGLYDSTLLLRRGEMPLAVPVSRMTRKAIIALYGGDIGLLAATWPAPGVRRWDTHAAQEAIIAACCRTLVTDPERHGFRLLRPWIDRTGNPVLLGSREWAALLACGRARLGID